MKNKFLTGLKVAGICGLVGLTGFGLAGCANSEKQVSTTPSYQAVQSYDEFRQRALDVLDLATVKTYVNHDGMFYNVKATLISDGGNYLVTQSYLKDDGTVIMTLKLTRGQQTVQSDVTYGKLNEDTCKYYGKHAQDEGEDVITTEVEDVSIRNYTSGAYFIDGSIDSSDVLDITVNEKGNYVYYLAYTKNGEYTVRCLEVTPDATIVRVTTSVASASGQNTETITFEYGVVKYADVKAMYDVAVAAFAQA